MNYKEITIIDVRSFGEFQCGNVAGSKNIPLNELERNIENIKEIQTPIVVCCASGMRSEQAKMILQQHGISCINGGSWLDMNYQISLENEK